MELLILLGIGLTVGAVVLIDDHIDDDDDDQQDSTETPVAENPDAEDPDGEEIRLNASGGADDVTGSDQDETVFAFGGDDLVEGRGGDDRIFGGDGTDAIVGGEGDDLLRGGAGDDTLIDNEGADTIHGDTGDDRIVVTSGIDGEALAEYSRGVVDGTITDFSGIDQLADFDTDTDDASDTVFAGIGDDTVVAGDGDVISLGEGSDRLAVGDWMLSGDDPVIVTDFDPSEDVLTFSHDGDGPMPRLSVLQVGDGTGDEGQGSAILLADDVFVARIEGAGGLLSVSDISITARNG